MLGMYEDCRMEERMRERAKLESELKVTRYYHEDGCALWVHGGA